MHVGRRVARDEGLVLGAVLRADRPQQHGPAAELDGLLELLRVRPYREVAPPARRRRVDPDARVEGHHAVGVGQQRVDVELDHLGQVRRQLRQLDERQFHGRPVHGTMRPRIAQQLRHPGPAHQLPCQRDVQRWQCDGSVGDGLDRGAALAEHQHRPEDRVDRDAEDQFVAALVLDHLLHRQALDARIRPALPGPRQDGLGRRQQQFLRADVEHDAADVGLVRDVRRVDLQGQRITQPVADPGQFLERSRHLGLDDRDRVGGQHALGLRLRQHRAPTAPDCAGHFSSRRCTARSAITMIGIIVCVAALVGITDESITYTLSSPCTFRFWSTTPVSADKPMRHVP